jgi:hypothetical protein
LHAQQGEGSIELPTTEKIDFKGVKSQRIVIGARGESEGVEKIKPYVGIAMECELDGQINASVTGMPMEAINLKGMTGKIEFGIKSVLSNVTLNLDLRGYLGEKKGIAGMVKANYPIGGAAPRR